MRFLLINSPTFFAAVEILLMVLPPFDGIIDGEEPIYTVGQKNFLSFYPAGRGICILTARVCADYNLSMITEKMSLYDYMRTYRPKKGRGRLSSEAAKR